MRTSERLSRISIIVRLLLGKGKKTKKPHKNDYTRRPVHFLYLCVFAQICDELNINHIILFKKIFVMAIRCRCTKRIEVRV